MMSPEEKMIYEIFGGMDVTGKGTSWQKLTNASEEYRQKMFDNVKKEFIQENGVSNGDTITKFNGIL